MNARQQLKPVPVAPVEEIVAEIQAGALPSTPKDTSP